MPRQPTGAEPAIECSGLGKAYVLAHSPWQRLMHHLRGRSAARLHWALHGVDLRVARGEVVGVVGQNGAGKSTLLQLICGTLTPSAGTLGVRGRVAALLELGAGFNPQFTGRENALLNAALLGLSPEQAQARLEEMLRFADIGEFIDRPVRTYSSGMFMRLAFAVATAVEPDILVIDEALSVGDGAFARKSFERVMQLKAQGATILFCSHSMYQVEALCDRALWIDGGRLRMAGTSSQVCGAYQAYLNGLGRADPREPKSDEGECAGVPAAPTGTARITGFSIRLEGQLWSTAATVRSGIDDLILRYSFVSDPALPQPTLALGVSDENGLTVSSALSLHDGARIDRRPDGSGQMELVLPRLPLLKGRYWLTAFVLSEDGLHAYDQVMQAAVVTVVQDGPLQGLVALPRVWRAASSGAAAGDPDGGR